MNLVATIGQSTHPPGLAGHINLCPTLGIVWGTPVFHNMRLLQLRTLHFIVCGMAGLAQANGPQHICAATDLTST
jgi:hypothetical protein